VFDVGRDAVTEPFVERGPRGLLAEVAGRVDLLS
jgi:hypothetical protein